jgi:hypothetical protein
MRRETKIILKEDDWDIVTNVDLPCFFVLQDAALLTVGELEP